MRQITVSPLELKSQTSSPITLVGLMWVTVIRACFRLQSQLLEYRVTCFTTLETTTLRCLCVNGGVRTDLTFWLICTSVFFTDTKSREM